jgi:hypothetical protein
MRGAGELDSSVREVGRAKNGGAAGRGSTRPPNSKVRLLPFALAWCTCSTHPSSEHAYTCRYFSVTPARLPMIPRLRVFDFFSRLFPPPPRPKAAFICISLRESNAEDDFLPSGDRSSGSAVASSVAGIKWF